MACPTCNMIRGLLMSQGIPEPVAQKAGNVAGRRIEAPVKRKVKRKVSAYQRRFGIELKKLKKSHPRTAIGTLMKRAHRATKKVMK